MYTYTSFPGARSIRILFSQEIGLVTLALAAWFLMGAGPVIEPRAAYDRSAVLFESRQFSFRIEAPDAESSEMLDELRRETLEDRAAVLASGVDVASCAAGWAELRFVGPWPNETLRLCRDDARHAALIRKLELMVAYYDRERKSLWRRQAPKAWQIEPAAAAR